MYSSNISFAYSDVGNEIKNNSSQRPRRKNSGLFDKILAKSFAVAKKIALNLYSQAGD